MLISLRKKGFLKWNLGKILNPFLDGDVPRRASYGVYILHLIRFASLLSFADFTARNKCLTAKLLQQGYRYH